MDIAKLSPKSKCVFALELGKKAGLYFQDDDVKSLIDEAFKVAWEWVLTENDVEYTGDILYNFLDNEENGFALFEENEEDEKNKAAWNCIIYTIAYISRAAYDKEGAIYFPEPIELVDDDIFPHMVQSLISCDGKEREYIENVYQDCLKEDLPLSQTDIKYVPFDSASELREYLRKQTVDHILLLGEDSEVVNSATAIIIEKSHLIIGVFTDGIGDLECQFKDNTFFVGFNHEVVCIKEGKIINRVSDAVFYEFIELPQRDNLVVALFELGIACFNTYGELCWHKHTGDIITGFAIQYDKLVIKLYEGGNVTIDIDTGALSRPS